MNTHIFKQVLGSARLVAILICASMTLTTRTQTLPCWDVSPGAGANCAYVPLASDAGGHGGGVVAKNGAFFEASTCAPDPSVIYEWNKCTNWAQIGLVAGEAYTMCIGGRYLYVGGYFTNIDGQGPFTNIAKYDVICGGWSQVGDNSITAAVQAIAVDSAGNVYAGMRATVVNGNWPYGQLDTNIFKMWNGTSWQAVGGGLIDTAYRAHNGTSLSGVTALAADGTNIYVGGDFDGSTSLSSYELIKWTGSSFQQMVSSPTMWDWDTGRGEYYAGPSLTQIAVSGSNVFVVGWFYRADASGFLSDPVGLARFSTNGGWYGDTNMSLIWSQSLDPQPGMSVAVQNGFAYFSGVFDSVGSVVGGLPAYTNTAANGIAMWSNGIVLSLGTGSTLGGNMAYISGVAADSNAVYVVSPSFDAVGGISTLGPAARWLTGLNEPCNRMIDVRFTGFPDTNILTGAAVIGCPSDRWNTLNASVRRTAPTQKPQNSSLFTVSGAGAGAAIWDDSWVIGQPASSIFTNVVMQHYHTSPWGGTLTNITIQGLPHNGFSPGLPAYYDIYLYACTATNAAYQNNAIFSLTPTGCTSGSQETVTTVGWDPNTWVEGGQYVVFRGIPISSHSGVSDNLVISVSAPDTNAVVNGVQILPRQ